MDSTFFRSKRPWSRYKDFLLDYYLEPYIPKVARLGKPILIADCFAGQGRFGDGEVGSPIIIAEAIKKWRSKGTRVSGQFIEADPENFAALQAALSEHQAYCTPRLGAFDEILPDLERSARQNTVFLYVDPYTVKGLLFDRMKEVFDHIHVSGSSVEVLMNFNVAIFMRWALAALKRIPDLPDDADVEPMADDPNESVEQQLLSRIAGGDYWDRIVSDETLAFNEKLEAFFREYNKLLGGSFRYVCNYWVKEKYHHRIPKYVMIYATRHPDGVQLMNDAMCKAWRDFVKSEFGDGRLFDVTPDEELVDSTELRSDIFDIVATASSSPTRPDTHLELFLRGNFGRMTKSEINSEIKEMLKNGVLHSSTGKSRINDSVRLSTTPFT